MIFRGEKVSEIEVVSDGGGRRWMQWTVCLFLNSDPLICQNINIDLLPSPSPEEIMEANNIFEL